MASIKAIPKPTNAMDKASSSQMMDRFLSENGKMINSVEMPSSSSAIRSMGLESSIEEKSKAISCSGKIKKHYSLNSISAGPSIKCYSSIKMLKKYKFSPTEVFHPLSAGPIYEVVQDRSYDGED